MLIKSLSRGFSLFEVLIALTILSVSLLYINAGELKNLQYTKAAYSQNLAVNQLEEGIWEKNHHVVPSIHSILPAMNFQDAAGNLELSWQSPITEWHCFSLQIANRSCIQ